MRACKEKMVPISELYQVWCQDGSITCLRKEKSPRRAKRVYTYGAPCVRGGAPRLPPRPLFVWLVGLSDAVADVVVVSLLRGRVCLPDCWFIAGLFAGLWFGHVGAPSVQEVHYEYEFALLLPHASRAIFHS